MNKNYNLKLDLQFRCNNSKMVFDEFDENTSDFFMQITRQGKEIDISNSIPALLVLKPSGTAVSQILNVKDNLIYGNLNNSLKNEVGTYIAKLMLVEGDKKTFISNISYEVTENALLGKIDNDIVEDERYSVLLQLLERLSNIELQEKTRIDNENSRTEAENLRQEAIEKVKNDIDVLTNETNKKVNDNLNSNTSKIDNLIINTKEELNKYKENKDKFINENLEEFKENANKSIQDYKTSKDIEINNTLNAYKTNTTNDINSFKNTVNSKIDKYKNDKDKAINEYVEGKSLELDNYVEVKNNELDLYVSEKDILIDSKISEIDNAKTQMQDSVNNKLTEVDNAEQIRQQEHESRQQFLNGFEGKLNTVVDDIAGIKDDVVSVREANKRQDVFLQGLYNENLDGRVTVKEEGSVISLTNSDDGLVDIVGLEGNTLVNYVQDGAKELTLNGDIEVEGTNVTLTEGVANGLVDVALEGNTLVNLFDKNVKFTRGKHQNIEGANIYYQKEIPMATNGTFHIIAPIGDKSSNSSDARLMIFKYNKTNNTGTVVRDYTVNSNPSLNLVVSLTREEVLLFNCWSIADDNFNKNYPTMMILEGDWTDKEIPQYFEGMKSVGECEDNKLEIVSRKNLNLFNRFGVFEGYNTNVTYNILDNNNNILVSKGVNPHYGLTKGIVGQRILLEQNTDYILEARVDEGDAYAIINDYNTGKLITKVQSRNYGKIEFNSNNATEIFLVPYEGNTSSSYYTYINLYKSDLSNDIYETGVIKSPYIDEFKTNKKEITLSEPLRALPNGVKDKIVKVGGKWYVERNCIEERVSDTWKWTKSSSAEDYYYYTDDRFKFGEHQINVLCDKFKSATISQANDKNFYTNNNNYVALGLYAGMGVVVIDLSSDKLLDKTVSGFQEYLRNNEINIIYPLVTPTYEEITDIELITYLDTTHISNNSTIPCNMTVKNTGYNTIIKPSTQYTVAFDTDKSGKVGINLGGAKVTTTNNVATVTTPATLVDDTLRLTGKGIKASKVRLLEGDKTNYIPSFFEGIKSCFEENLQEDESYKVEIISSNLDSSKSNKLQLRLNEPLRAVGDIKDKLVFKDNKFIIERNCSIREYQEGDFELDNILTDKTNTTYILNEPIYEEVPYETQKLILECFKNGTLFIDTLIPPTVSVTYSANNPVVAKLNQVDNTTNVNTEDIAITQMAVDFLLMSSLGEEMLNFKVKSGYNMASYFASRIIKGALKYEDVINKYPQYKEDINSILISEGHSDLIVEL